MAEDQFYIVSVMHTLRRDRYITVWRPNDSGYAYPLSWAGKYSESNVRENLSYYNSGCSNVAVPCHVLDYLAIPPMPGVIDNDAGPVVPNSAESWRRILANLIAEPAHAPRPEYRGARHSKTA